MDDAPFRAEVTLRAIRDQLLEETKDLSRDDLLAFFAREAAVARAEARAATPPSSAHGPGRSAAHGEERALSDAFPQSWAQLDHFVARHLSGEGMTEREIVRWRTRSRRSGWPPRRVLKNPAIS